MHSVVLDEQLLASSEGLAAAPNLVAVSLRDNLLTDVSGLQGCTALQQLSLAGNLITQVMRVESQVHNTTAQLLHVHGMLMAAGGVTSCTRARAAMVADRHAKIKFILSSSL